MSTSLHADRRVQPVRSNRLLRLQHVLQLAMHWPARTLARQRAEQTETAALRSMGHSERRDLHAAAAQLPAQRPLPDDALRIVARREKQDPPAGVAEVRPGLLL